jgi:hypothetical protein
MRAQGLPLTTIVVAVLALVLVFFIFAFVLNIGGIADVFGDLFSGGQAGMTISSFRNRCELLCSSATNFDPCSPLGPAFCTEVRDTSGDGGISDDHCYDDGQGAEVIKGCNVRDSYGDYQTLDSVYCDGFPHSGGNCP